MSKSKRCPVCGRASHRINEKWQACDGECLEGLKSIKAARVMRRALRSRFAIGYGEGI